MEFLPAVAVVLFSLTIHEFAHGWVADLCGDDTARSQGRVTLNPLPHIDPVGTVLMPLGLYFLGLPLFGWARPTPVVPSRMRHPRLDALKVAAAGPGANVLLALAAALLVRLTPWPLLSEGAADLFRGFLAYAVLINLFLALFNLLPIYPLDGGQLLSGVLPKRVSGRLLVAGQWVLAILLITNVLPVFLWPVVKNVARALGVG